MPSAFDKVEQLRKEDTSLSISQACKKAGIGTNAYYYHARKAKGVEPVKQAKARKVVRKSRLVEPVKPEFRGLDRGPERDAKQMLLLLGSPSQLKAVLGGIL